MNTKEYIYSWHLSLRVDRPVEGCTMHPHAYMYGKKLDEREFDKTLPLHSKKMKEPPPQHEFSYRWFRGPLHEACAYEQCPRRTSFSPHDWSKHALGGPESALQCVSTQSSLYRCTFCNADCFVRAWKTQYTVPRELLQSQQHQQQYQMMNMQNQNQQPQQQQPLPQQQPHQNQQYQQQMMMLTNSSNPYHSSNYNYYNTSVSGSATPVRSRSASVGSDFDSTTSNNNNNNMMMTLYALDSTTTNPNSGESKSPTSSSRREREQRGPTPPPRGHIGYTQGGGGSSSNSSAASANLAITTTTTTSMGVDTNNNTPFLITDTTTTDEEQQVWMEISRDPLYVPGPDDVGRKLKIEASAYSLDSGELLMSRVVKTDVVLAKAPDPMKRTLVSHNHNNNSNNNNSKQQQQHHYPHHAHSSSTASASSTSGGAGGVGVGSGGGLRFRVATYNVLAEIYATQQQYPHCDFWALSWDYRFQNIVREIVDAAPDVLCLQEIQADHYETHVYATLSDAGYEGVFKQKTRPSMGLAGKVDGCALFWKRSKFHLVESYSIEFNELAQRQATQLGLLNNPSRGEEYAAFINRLSKDNVAQLVVLEFIQSTLPSQPPSSSLSSLHPSQSSSQPSNRSGRGVVGGGGGSGGVGGMGGLDYHPQQVCIANTHLYSHKDFPDVKLWQTWQLLMELESFIVGRGSNLPLVMCGDFNSTPDTAVYDLLSRQAVHPGHPDVNVLTGDDNLPSVLPDAMNISHSFQLGSAYQSVLGEEPWTTNYTLQFKGVLDYIWYSATNIVPITVALIPDESQILKHGEALPSTEFSSDHIMLISDLQIVMNHSSNKQ